jgi:hypothetical protein
MKVRVTSRNVVVLVVAIFLFKRFMPAYHAVVYNYVVMYKKVWIVALLAYFVLNSKSLMTKGKKLLK